MSRNLTTDIIEFAKKNGADLSGIADVSLISNAHAIISDSTRSHMNRAFVCAIRLSGAILSEICEHPTKTYYHHYRMVNMALDQLGLSITRFLQSHGFSAYPVPASQVIDWENQQGIVSHKHAAVKAGLGWIGRNNLLVTPEYGSQIRLVSVLTDAQLKPSPPIDEDCGACRACLDVCPAQAIADDPEAFNHRTCYAQLDWFVKKRYVGQHICGICVRACSPEQVSHR